MEELTYTQNGDFLIPNIKLKEEPGSQPPLGKYGMMRKTFLKEHKSILYDIMVLEETLFPHLREIDAAARQRLDEMMPVLAKEAGATEDLKARDPMRWVGLMNNCKAQAEEIILTELVYS